MSIITQIREQQKQPVKVRSNVDEYNPVFLKPLLRNGYFVMELETFEIYNMECFRVENKSLVHWLLTKSFLCKKTDSNKYKIYRSLK